MQILLNPMVVLGRPSGNLVEVDVVDVVVVVDIVSDVPDFVVDVPDVAVAAV